MLRYAVAAAAVMTMGALPAAAQTHHDWNTASTVGAGILAAAALGIPVARDDLWEGGGEALGSMAVGGGSAYLLKRVIHEQRPDGSDNRSFPSEHAAISFAAAATLEKRYGWKYGIPAFALASFVGVARVEARKHYWYDVVAGAALGTASGFVITSRYDGRVRLTPWAGSGGGGAAMSMKF